MKSFSIRDLASEYIKSSTSFKANFSDRAAAIMRLTELQRLFRLDASSFRENAEHQFNESDYESDDELSDLCDDFASACYDEVRKQIEDAVNDIIAIDSTDDAERQQLFTLASDWQFEHCNAETLVSDMRQHIVEFDEQ